MVKHLWRALLLALTCTAAAHAAGKHEPWHAVEKLKPGEDVLVRVASQQRFEECTLISADDSTLTCQRESDPNITLDAASNARLVFPHSAIADVWLLQVAHERHIGRWIAIGVSATLVIAASVASGTAGAMLVGGIVATYWIVWWLESPLRFPKPAQPQIRRRLIYRSAVP